MKPLFRLLQFVLLFLLMIMLPTWVSATGPRIKQDIFAPNPNQIYALDFPPFVTTELPTGGIAVELVTNLLKAQSLDAVINTLPVASMMKYYLLQEQALGLITSHLQINKEEQKDLIYIPLLQIQQYFYYFQAKHPEGLPWNGDLKTLAHLSFGVNEHENLEPYKKAEINLQTGKNSALYEKLHAGQLDFIADSPLTVNWYLDKHYLSEKTQFIKMQPKAGDELLYLIINKKHPQGDVIAKQFQMELGKMLTNDQYNTLLTQQLGNGQKLTEIFSPLPVDSK